VFLGRVFRRPSRIARAKPATRSLPNGRAFGAPCRRFVVGGRVRRLALARSS